MRRWTLPLPHQPAATPNQRSWQGRWRASQAWRQAAGWVARAQGVPRLEAASVALWVRPPDWRRRDADSWALALKHCIDGLVDAGVLPDDSWPHVPEVSVQVVLPDGSGRWEWRLSVSERAPLRRGEVAG